MNNIKSEYLVGLIFGLSVPFIWGAWIVISRFGVITSLNAYDITALRVGVASIIVLPIVALSIAQFEPISTSSLIITLPT